MNDREKLLQAIRRSIKKPLPKLYLKGWSVNGYTEPPANPPENSLVIELVPLQPTAVVEKRPEGKERVWLAPPAKKKVPAPT